MIRFLGAVAFLMILALPAKAAWQDNLTTPGTFSVPREYTATYGFGWSGLPAGDATVRAGILKGDRIRLEANGRSTGIARSLWRLDATHWAEADAASLDAAEMHQREVYRSRTYVTDVEFEPDAVVRTRSVIPVEKDSGKSKRQEFPSPRDLHSAFLVIRSQAFRPGDKYRLVVYPSTDAYLATVTVEKRETVRVPAGRFNAIRCSLALQRIGKKGKLEPHGKFKRATVWISDDADRVLLRAEAEIFVGSVWAELQKFTPKSP